MKGGFRESPLRLNEGLGQLQTWDAPTIESRGARLSDHAVRLWPAPHLDDAVVAAYRPGRSARGTQYSIEDHPHLLIPELRMAFEAFRAEVLALDPCVTEEFMKLYVAYKAETNFVDVVPQAKRLRLTLNIAFDEISDPRGICKDVTDIGRWGNGDVEVGLQSLDELPYVIGLVRQSLDRQLGGEDG
jgi:predicted transport protein